MEHTVSPLLRLLDKDEDPSFDAFLYIGEKLVLKAHKSILGLSVPFFERSFRSGMKEAETGEVKFPEKKVSKDTLRTLVRSVYGEKLVIDETNARDIHATANFMEMDEVSEKCVKFMRENLKVDTVLSLWEYSLTDFTGSKKLLKGCEEFIAGHFLDLYKNENFLNLGVDFMCAFLSLDNLCVSSENDVFDALLCWLNHDWGNRFHLINERSLLDLVRWGSIDLSVQKLASLQHIRDHGHNSVAENNVLFMIYDKVIALPERPTESLTRVKFTPPVSTISVPSEVGSVYCLKGKGRNVQVYIYDPATELFRDPLPLDMPEGANHVVGMISHGSRPFVVVSGESVYKSGQCLLLLELQQGQIKSKVDLILPVEAQKEGHYYMMAAAPPNADKLCLGLAKDGSRLLVVYDLAFDLLESPKSEGSLGSLRCSQFVASIPSSGAGLRNIKIAYTPGQIWVVEQYETSSGCVLHAFSYELSSKCWTKPFVLASGPNAGRKMGSIMVMSEFIAVAVSSISVKVKLYNPYKESQCWVHIFKCNDLANARSVLQCSYVHDDYKWCIPSISMALMGQRLLVFMKCHRSIPNENGMQREWYVGAWYAFYATVDKDGKPMGQFSREPSMDGLEPSFTLPIQ